MDGVDMGRLFLGWFHPVLHSLQCKIQRPHQPGSWFKMACLHSWHGLVRSTSSLHAKAANHKSALMGQQSSRRYTAKCSTYSMVAFSPKIVQVWYHYTTGRITGAFTWPSLHDNCYKCQPNLTPREQSLLPAPDVFGVGWVIKRLSQSAAAKILSKMTHEPK